MEIFTTRDWLDVADAAITVVVALVLGMAVVVMFARPGRRRHR